MTKPDPRWSAAERAAWDAVLRGEVARPGPTPPPDPAEAAAWSPEVRDARRLSGGFLADILLRKPWCDALPQQGVRIEGALFEAPADLALDLAHASIDAQLWLEQCRFEGDVVLTDARCAAWFSLEASWIGGHLKLDGAALRSLASLKATRVTGNLDAGLLAVEGTLGAEGLAVEGNLNMWNGRIRGDITLKGARLDGTLDADGLSAARIILAEATIGGQALFRAARITGAAEFMGVTVTGRLEADSIAAGRVILGTADKPRGSFPGGIQLVAAEIGKDLDADNIEVGTAEAPARLDIARSEIGGDVWLRGTAVTGTVDAAFAELKGNLWIDNSALGALHMPGSRVSGDLHLGGGLTWAPDATLNLRAARVGAIGDTAKAWPAGTGSLMLAGFQYDRLGGFDGDDYSDWTQRDVAWFLDWLGRTSKRGKDADGRERDIGFRPETYERMARALRGIGRHDAADAVLFRAREIARADATGVRRWWLTLSRHVIGYGIGTGYFRAAAIAAGLAALGMLVVQADALLSGAPAGRPALASNGLLWGFFASLDHLLPIVTLDRQFADQLPAQLVGAGARLYFWLLGIAGWVLGVVLGYGLAGVAQRS